MFIERSAARIRRTRLAFLLLGLLPCSALVGWAAWQRSAGHRDQVRDRWQQATGLSLSIDRVEHPRPGVTLARGVAVVSPGGTRLIEVRSVEVETAVGEDRVRLDRVRLEAAAVRVAVELAREWLRRDVRHPRNCVIDVGEVSWPGAAGDATADDPATTESLRLECVAHAGTRAVRAMRSEGGGDLLRVVRQLVPGDVEPPAERIEVEAEIERPLPFDVAAALLDEDAPALVGPAATVQGRCSMTWLDGGWTGSASGRLDRVDLARCVVPLQAAAEGEASVEVERLAWQDGRLFEGKALCRAAAGWIDAALFDRITLALGCPPAPPAAGMPRRRFDAGACSLEVDGGKVAVRAVPELLRALAIVDGTVLLHEPVATVPFERLAWVLSPPTADFVPAGGAGAWLMSVRPDAGAARDARLPRDAAPRGDGRGF